MKKQVGTEIPESAQKFMEFLLENNANYLDIQLKNLANAICFLGAISTGELPENAEKKAITYLQELSHFHFELQNLKNNS